MKQTGIFIKGVWGDDDPNIEAELLAKLGVTAEELEKVKSGELSKDDFSTQYFSNYEKTIIDREKKNIEDAVYTDAFGKAFGKSKQTTLETFGLEAEPFKDKAFEDVLKAAKAAYDEKLEQFKNVDSNALKDYQDKLDLANKKIKDLNTDWEDKYNKLINEQKTKDLNQSFNKMQSDKIASVENPRLTAKEMRAMLSFEMRENGYTYEKDDDGRFWIMKNGSKVTNPNNKTQNLDFNSFFEIVAKEHKFQKQSNGGDNKNHGSVNLTDAQKEARNKLPKAYLEQMNKLGL